MSADNILIVLGILVVVGLVIGMLKKAIKLGLFIGIMVLALGSTSGGIYLKGLMKDYSFKIDKGKIEYTIKGSKGTIDIVDIEYVKVKNVVDTDDVNIVLKIKGIPDIDFNINKYMYGLAIKPKLKKELGTKFEDLTANKNEKVLLALFFMPKYKHCDIKISK